jgi:hypothetical protein
VFHVEIAHGIVPGQQDCFAVEGIFVDGEDFSGTREEWIRAVLNRSIRIELASCDFDEIPERFRLTIDTLQVAF